MLTIIDQSGIRTAYIRRETEDEHEEMEHVQSEVDEFFEGATPLRDLADFLLK